MGCDIHLVLEKKFDDRWVGINDFSYIDAAALRDAKGRISWNARIRNYRLFGRVAGVRTEGPAPRGIPDDVSDFARLRIHEWDADGHSHTWLSLREAIEAYTADREEEQKIEEVTAALTNKRTGPPPELRLFNLALDSDEDLDDYRIIFWFDN